MEEINTLTAWIPFDGSTHANGCMGYVPGSHHVGLNKFINIFSADEHEKILEDPKIAGVPPVYVEVPRGSVAFHHGLTVHMAKTNKSDRVRRVHTMIYFRDGATRSTMSIHPSVDRPGIGLGEPIGSDLTPIVWPRAIGDLPKPPRMPLTPILKTLNAYGALPSVE